MNEEILKIFEPLLWVSLLGVAMFVGARWSRRKNEEFQKTEAAQIHKNKLEGKPILEQLKSKETWVKVKDGMTIHDPRSDKAKALRNDITGTLGTIPFVITTLISIGLIVLYLFVFD